jgi:hypothetical protein
MTTHEHLIVKPVRIIRAGSICITHAKAVALERQALSATARDYCLLCDERPRGGERRCHRNATSGDVAALYLPRPGINGRGPQTSSAVDGILPAH